MSTASRAKHKLCRRVGFCLWGNPKCPSVKRPYPSGPSGKINKQKKLSTYGELLIEKQKLKAHYAISEKQLKLAYQRAKHMAGITNENLIRQLEMRLDAVLFRSGLCPSIHSAKQFICHRHVLVDGKVVDRSSYRLVPGQVVSISEERSPAIADVARALSANVPAYLELDREHCKVTVSREPDEKEVPVQAEVIRVVEFYAR